MTPEELRKLNEECCKFAGLEPSNINVCPRCGSPFSSNGYCSLRCLNCQGGRGEWVPIYPPVSTSWEAAGRLMDALAAMAGYRITVESYGGDGAGGVSSDPVCWGCSINWYPNVAQSKTGKIAEVWYRSAPTKPLSVALAVAELAKVSK